jgi:hypothetical protein
LNKSSFDHTRRLFIGGVALVAASSYIAAVGRGARKICDIQDADVLGNLRPLIRIGNAYLDEVAKSGEPSTLRKGLLDDDSMTLESIISAIRGDLFTAVSRAQDEFERGETVSCDGWVLSKAEARLCAKIAISVRKVEVKPRGRSKIVAG